MKRFFSLIIAVVMVACLCACAEAQPQAKPTEPTTIPYTEPVTEPTEETTPTEEITEPVTLPPMQTDFDLPLIALSAPLSTNSVQAEDGTVIFDYTCQDVAFFFDDGPVADRVMLNLLNFIDSASSDSILSSAKAAYTGQSDWSPYYLKVILNPQRLDQNILSLFGGELNGDGTSSSFAPRAITYDLATGNALSYRDVLTYDYDPQSLCQLIIDTLAPQAESAQLFWDYPDVIRDRFSDPNSYTEDWYLSGEGLCFYFSPYDIAPYVSGTIVAEIPYENLMGILNEAYFPAEQIAMDGSITATLFDENVLSEYNRFVEVTVDEGGEQILLYTDSAVSNVRIDLGSWDEDGVIFTAESTVFAANTLCLGDAVILQTYIPDAAPNLRLTYVSGNETVTRYISQSGMDSSILLLEQG